VVNWKTTTTYRSAAEWNLQELPLHDLIVDLRNDRSNSKTGNSFTACWYAKSHHPARTTTASTSTSHWTELSDNQLLNRFGVDFDEDYDDTSYSSYWPCTIVGSDKKGNDNDDDTLYTVRILDQSFQAAPRFVLAMPREYIDLFPKPYQSDQHRSDAFRHHIGIPDEMFPKQWKDRKANNDNGVIDPQYPRFQKHAVIEAFEDGEWFKGRIVNVSHNVYYDIEYLEDGFVEANVSPAWLLPSSLDNNDDSDREQSRWWKIGDSVQINWRLQGQFFQGSIVAATSLDIFYNVLFDDGDRSWKPESVVRQVLHKSTSTASHEEQRRMETLPFFL
jgi:hypothetical protein